MKIKIKIKTYIFINNSQLRKIILSIQQREKSHIFIKTRDWNKINGIFIHQKQLMKLIMVLLEMKERPSNLKIKNLYLDFKKVKNHVN